MSTRHAIIGGGMGDIGKAIAVTLAEDGVVLTILSSAVPNKSHADFIATLKGEGHSVVQCDLTNRSHLEEVVAQKVKEIGQFDICIHAAVSPLVRAYAASIPGTDFREQFEVGLFGGFNLFQSVIPAMKKNKQGHLIGITSKALQSERPTKMAGYTCAKFALHGLLRELALELEASRIQVNAVAPGFVPTKLHADIPARGLEFIAHGEPGGILTTPEDVASVVSYLCSERATGISGMMYPVKFGEPTKL